MDSFPPSCMMYLWRVSRRCVCGWLIFLSAALNIIVFIDITTKSSNANPEEGKLPCENVSQFLHRKVELSKPFLIYPKINCNQQSAKTIVIVVISKASHLLERDTVRHTWGNVEMQTRYNFSLYFLLGTEENIHIDDESSLNNDIIQADIEESFYHLSEKTIDAFKWITFFCHKAEYFFKTDDDVYFDLEFLREIEKDQKYLTDDVILGHCVFLATPERVIEREKYKVTLKEYPFDMYPPYCGGPGYLMTSKTAHRVYSKMLTTRVFKFEDVYLGLVAYELGLSLKHVNYFIYLMVKGQVDRDFYVRCSRVTHGLTPTDIHYYWNNLNNHIRDRHDCV